MGCAGTMKWRTFGASQPIDYGEWFMAMSMAMNSQCFVIMQCIGDHSFHQHRCCHKYWYGQSDVWPEPVRRKWIERCPGLQHYGTDELRVFPSRALISFRMFGVDSSGSMQGKYWNRSVCVRSTISWNLCHWTVKCTRRVHNDYHVSTRLDVGTRQDALLTFLDEQSVTLKISARSRESDVECYTLRVIGLIQYKATLSQVACVLLSCRESRKSMPILEIVDYINQQCITREIHISNLRLYTKADMLVSDSK